MKIPKLICLFTISINSSISSSTNNSCNIDESINNMICDSKPQKDKNSRLVKSKHSLKKLKSKGQSIFGKIQTKLNTCRLNYISEKEKRKHRALAITIEEYIDLESSILDYKRNRKSYDLIIFTLERTKNSKKSSIKRILNSINNIDMQNEAGYRALQIAIYKRNY